MKKEYQKLIIKKTQQQQNNEALLKISMMGSGLKPEIIDWANIGRNAVSLAKETLRKKCKECGR